MTNSIQPNPDHGKNTPQDRTRYGITPRGINNKKQHPGLSRGAQACFNVLDSRLGGRPGRVGRKLLAEDLGVDVRTVSNWLNQLVAENLIGRKRTGRTTIYTLTNQVREEKTFLSDRKKLSYPQSNTSRVLLKQQQEESAPLSAAPFSSAAASAGAKPYWKLPKQQRDYVSEFNLTLKTNFGSCLDLNALKQEPIAALLKLQNQGYEAQDLAIRCSQRLKDEVKQKESHGDRIKQPMAWLVSRLPSWLEDSELWESNQREAPDYVPSSEHLPPTYFESNNSEPMTEEEYYEPPVKLTEEELVKLEQQRIENKLIEDSLRHANNLTRLKKRYANRSKSELKAIYFNQHGTTITDEELDL